MDITTPARHPPATNPPRRLERWSPHVHSVPPEGPKFWTDLVQTTQPTGRGARRRRGPKLLPDLLPPSIPEHAVTEVPNPAPTYYKPLLRSDLSAPLYSAASCRCLRPRRARPHSFARVVERCLAGGELGEGWPVGQCG
jgi:hypothetical protein